MAQLLQGNSTYEDVFETTELTRLKFSMSIRTPSSHEPNTANSFKASFGQESIRSRLQIIPFVSFKKSGELSLTFSIVDLLNPFQTAAVIKTDLQVDVSQLLETLSASQQMNGIVVKQQSEEQEEIDEDTAHSLINALRESISSQDMLPLTSEKHLEELADAVIDPYPYKLRRFSSGDQRRVKRQSSSLYYNGLSSEIDCFAQAVEEEQLSSARRVDTLMTDTFNEANNCSASKGNAVNMAKNILKGFMEYVMVSAKEVDLVACCSSTSTTRTNENEGDNWEIAATVEGEQMMNEVEKIRKRFRKQYSSNLLEKPSNSKLLKFFANISYGKLFQHYFSSEEIIQYIEASSIQNKQAHIELVDRIRSTQYDANNLQEVLKTRVFKRPPFQRPSK